MDDIENLDATAPGGVYLCQVSETVSCGACCGLYNVADPSRGALTDLLARRTERFAAVPREPQALTAFQASVAAGEDASRPFAEFHHCPFLGLVGASAGRVGCLLHPLAEGNRGVDWRGLSEYGALACRTYFCPTHQKLPATARRIVRALAPDWHLYGLVITEAGMLAAFFGEIERRIHRPLGMEDITGSNVCREAVGEFLEFKRDWPFRPAPRTPLPHYFFNDGLYARPPAPSPPEGDWPAGYGTIFQALETRWPSPAAARRAAALLERIFSRIAAALK